MLMSWDVWLSFCITETVLCFIPGPAVLFVVSAALARGARPGLAAACGILAANAFYFGLSATGIAAVILASSQLFAVLKWLGAAYLIVLGLRMLMSRTSAPIAASPVDVGRFFLRGVVVQGANPKALLFFVALLPQFINAAAPVGAQIAVLGVSSVLIEFLVLTLYVGIAVRARAMAGPRVATTLERVGGGVLVAAGARLALVRT
jgi:homoserine/homoserine lactone efflux protein